MMADDTKEQHVPDAVKEAQAEPNFTVTDSDLPPEFKSSRAKAEEKPKPEDKPAPDAKPDGSQKQGDPGDEDDDKTPTPEAKGGEDSDGDDDKPDPAEEWQKVPEGVRKRVARQTRQLREKDEQLAVMNARIEALEAGLTAKPAKAEELDPDDFDTFEEYKEAQKAQKDAAKKKPEDKPQKDERATAFETQLAASGMTPEQFLDAQGKLEEAISTVDPDLWEQAAESKELKISVSLVASLSETENPAKVLKAIMASADKGAAFSAMTPFQQARELAKLDAAPTSPPKKTTNAPEPIDTVQTRGRPMGQSYAEMSQADFEKRRAEEEAANGGRFGFM